MNTIRSRENKTSLVARIGVGFAAAIALSSCTGGDSTQVAPTTTESQVPTAEAPRSMADVVAGSPHLQKMFGCAVEKASDIHALPKESGVKELKRVGGIMWGATANCDPTLQLDYAGPELQASDLTVVDMSCLVAKTIGIQAMEPFSIEVEEADLAQECQQYLVGQNLN